MRHDMCTVNLGEQRVLSFMTVALGLMCDLDIGKLEKDAIFVQWIDLFVRYGTPPVLGRRSFHVRLPSRMCV